MKTNDTRKTVNDIITERIMAILEQGAAPWQKPWRVASQMPRNLVSGKPYRGLNVFLLHALQYASPFWLTFKQAQDLGGHVKRGEKAMPVVFWKKLETEDEQTGETKASFILRYYSVFNLAQVENVKQETPAPTTEATPTPAHEIVDNMPTRPAIKHGFRACCYHPHTDEIQMAASSSFATAADYFSTLYHELTHASGAKSRLNRPTLTASAGFGSNSYSKEELIAEMGAAFLCGEAGIFERTVNNSAAYLQGWLQVLDNDRNLIITAAAQAQKAADYILNRKHAITD
jgi:antirestriction protein ArdC